MDAENKSPESKMERPRRSMKRLVRPLPCPHCGADAELKRYQHDNSRVYYGCSMPRCSYTYAAEADALAAWNRRELSWELQHSARYILEDANPERLAEACGLPLGVIVAALENILPNARAVTPGANEKPLK
jgi:ssDNA-binding Zn-finger/Zn-ribbon topoisomerase 1